MRETVDHGKRYRLKYRGENIYITVSDNEGNCCPYSVTIHHTNERVNRDIDLLSSIDGAERFVNVSLRTVGVEETLRKCIAVARGWNTLYGLIFTAIACYLEGGE